VSAPAQTGAGALLALAPLRIEARAVRAGTNATEVVRTGYGPRRARRAVEQLASAARDARAVAVVGFGGALDPRLCPGDVVVADALIGPDGRRPLPGAGLVAAALRDEGLTVHVGAVVSTDRIVHGADRAPLHRKTGALAVDMESAWLARLAGERPGAVVRAIVDTPTDRLLALATVLNARRALRSLRRASAGLERWAAACAPRTVLLAGPRSFCAGVERAIDIVERALDRFGAPVFVRRQIVHNGHVVRDLEARGAVFVEELDEVPTGATVVLAAHGVAPEVREEADRRDLAVIDATCPLVAKVHHEARRFADRGFDIVLIGHADHEEVVGTRAEAPGAIHVVATAADLDGLEIGDGAPVAYLTQTTLATDETRDLVDQLLARFPDAASPLADDICYATQNRQQAVHAVAAEADLLLVVGSQNSSNANRLVEVARRAGCTAHLIEDDTEIDPRWLIDAATIGVTAGASAPEALVERVLAVLGSLGPLAVEERMVASESVRFTLPAEVR
jgi:4-hydroxy-3-methylbut-2-enyl diphosphate reductase